MHFYAVVALSAFLLFLVQPLIAKQILPWFGGSSAVWTTCMLFFQALLLAGKARAVLHGRPARVTTAFRVLRAEPLAQDAPWVILRTYMLHTPCRTLVRDIHIAERVSLTVDLLRLHAFDLETGDAIGRV